MKEVLVAVKSKFTISGLSLYLGEAKSTASIPYAIYHFINGIPDDERSTFTTDSEDVEIQFSIYAPTAAHAFDYQTALHDLYDNCVLTVAGYGDVQMNRRIFQCFKDGDNYHAVTTYQILTDEEK